MVAAGDALPNKALQLTPNSSPLSICSSVLAVTSLAGSLIGATAIVNSEPGSPNVVLGILAIALLPVLFLKRDLGVTSRAVSTIRLRLGLTLYSLVQVLAGFFGGGTGTLILYILMSFFGVTIIQVAATQVIPFMALPVSSLVLFAASGIIDYRMGIVLMVGTSVGGYLGAHIAVKSGDIWVRRLFAVVVLASAAKLVLSQPWVVG